MDLIEALRASDDNAEAPSYVLRMLYDMKYVARAAAILLGTGAEIIIHEPFRKGFDYKDALFLVSISIVGEAIFITVFHPIITQCKKRIQALMQRAPDSQRDAIENTLYKYELDPVDFW